MLNCFTLCFSMKEPQWDKKKIPWQVFSGGSCSQCLRGTSGKSLIDVHTGSSLGGEKVAEEIAGAQVKRECQ